MLAGRVGAARTPPSWVLQPCAWHRRKNKRLGMNLGDFPPIPACVVPAGQIHVAGAHTNPPSHANLARDGVWMGSGVFAHNQSRAHSRKPHPIPSSIPVWLSGR